MNAHRMIKHCVFLKGREGRGELGTEAERRTLLMFDKFVAWYLHVFWGLRGDTTRVPSSVRHWQMLDDMVFVRLCSARKFFLNEICLNV